MKFVVDKRLDVFVFCFFPSVQRRMERASDRSLRPIGGDHAEQSSEPRKRQIHLTWNEEMEPRKCVYPLPRNGLMAKIALKKLMSPGDISLSFSGRGGRGR